VSRQSPLPGSCAGSADAAPRSTFQALLLLFLLLAPAAPAAAESQLREQIFEWFEKPEAVAAPGVLHVFYQRRTVLTEEVVATHREFIPGQGWSAERRLLGGYVAVAFHDNALYVFRPRDYSVRQGDEWRTYEWTLPWAVAGAGPVGAQLFMFGVEVSGGQTLLHAATFIPDPTYAHLRPMPEGDDLTLSASLYDLTVVSLGRSAMVFWHQAAADPKANQLWHSTFDGAEWSAPAQVALPYEDSDYTAAEHGGSVWLFCKRRGLASTLQYPLQAMVWRDGAWTDPTPVPNVVDPLFYHTVDLGAVSFGGELWVLRGCEHRMVLNVWRDGEWQAPQMLFAKSAWRVVVLWWWTGNSVLGLALLPIVAALALRARRRAVPRVKTRGTDAPVASWARRVGALLVDLLITETMTVAAAQALWPSADEVGPLDLVPSLAILHVTVVFLYFAISEGVGGQSLGKAVLGIMVVGQDGRRASLRSIVIRNLLRPPLILAPVVYLVGSIVLLATAKQQRLGDLLGRTLVVELPRLAPKPSPPPF